MKTPELESDTKVLPGIRRIKTEQLARTTSFFDHTLEIFDDGALMALLDQNESADAVEFIQAM
ncbi:hypothetical protein SS50377_28533 [Spironucleus salmonicida]|uniref:Uncharacterized protein n=1 Tax=Spironucleus salmonicida TaxID=348837 RepID=V6LB01_9EUKA|nr:hypothetical protein SS50377_28533 [Spironucleus salmonicida]|eukprot:EST41635.1 Hypothetical protein SS50377_18991 [Spironucleus salmonicida]